MIKLQIIGLKLCVCFFLFVCCFQDKVAKAQETKDLAMSSLAQAIEDEKKEQWRTEGRSMLFDAKRVSTLDDYALISPHFQHSCCLVFTPDISTA